MNIDQMQFKVQRTIPKVAVSACLTVLVSCGPSVEQRTVYRDNVDDARISVVFQDFAEGTTCSVGTPGMPLTVERLPGKIDYPGRFRSSPVKCVQPDGATYSIDIDGMLPEKFRIAGFTAYPTQGVFGTISTGDELLNVQSETAVGRVN